MNGVAFANSKLVDLLPSDLSEFDRNYWLVSSQGGWTPLEGKPTEADWNEFDTKLESCLVDAAALEGSEMSLIDIERFSEIIPHLVLDEWTYLVGFQIPTEYLGCVLEDRALFDSLLPAFFPSLAKHKATAICYIGEWWECFPSESTLLTNLGSGLKKAESSSQKWVKFAGDYKAPINPNLNG